LVDEARLRPTPGLSKFAGWADFAGFDESSGVLAADTTG
jgi:hypothetical protein